MIKLNLQNLILRPWRLAILTILIAFAFAQARLILFVLLFLLLFIAAIKTYVTRKKSYFGILMPVMLVGLVIGIYYIAQYKRVVNYIKDYSPLELEMVADGVYEGTGRGLRGPIKLKVSIIDGKIQDIEVVQHQEAITALDGLREQFITQNRLDFEPVPATVHGSIQAAAGYQEAVTNALWKGVEDRPQFNTITQLIHHFTKFRFGRVTWNALAILFTIMLVFDYSLQPVLIKGTGQSLNCYNCQTCVGACPVKVVDGEPYPMTMVLAARLGDYEKVKELARYCVACSRCAGKCPVGDSAPSIAAACVSILRKQKMAA